MQQDYCFHIHTARCGHSDNTLTDSDIARGFFEAGLKVIAFTDHNPWITFLDDKPHHAMRWEQKEEYLKSIHTLKTEYEGKMEIFTGFEMEYMPELRSEMDEIKASSEITLIGQHFIKGKDRYYSVHKKDYVPTEYDLDSYADALEGACADGYADILVHPDLYMIHIPDFGKKEEEIAHKICNIAVKYNKPLEINLCRICRNRFFKPGPCEYPRKEFWEIAAEHRKLKVLFGMDYHGYFHPSNHSDMINEACNIIGKNTVERLQFLNLNEAKAQILKTEK